jgi:hypothetical protein
MVSRLEMSHPNTNAIADFSALKYVIKFRRERDLTRKELNKVKKKYLELRNTVINCRNCSVGQNNIDSEEEVQCPEVTSKKEEAKKRKFKKIKYMSDSSE